VKFIKYSDTGEPEEADIEVGDLGIRIAADESAHTAEDVKTRIQMG